MNTPFTADDQLLPAIIQDATTQKVLMLGYMNRAAYQKTTKEKRVCFYSRSKQRLWTKGESSGNFLQVQSIALDCDEDTFLVQVNPLGPTCHKGTATCWGKENPANGQFLDVLEATIQDRLVAPSSDSYTAQLVKRGINKVAQKVGEEAVELVIESKDNNPTLFIGEAADLFYHIMVLLAAKGIALEEVMKELVGRHTAQK